MRAVVDTNVLVSGLLSDSGPPRKIVDHVLSGTVDVCCPMIYDHEGLFYDGWAYMYGGTKFIKSRELTGMHPMFFEPSPHPRGLYPLDTAGSCLVMKGRCAHTPNSRPDLCVKGWTHTLKEVAYSKIWVDPHIQIVHPLFVE